MKALGLRRLAILQKMLTGTHGLLPTFMISALLISCNAETAPEPAHGLVLVVLDTLRADGLSAYGNPRPTSPAIDGLAQRGVLFENALSHASSTLPGFAGLLAGHYPSDRVLREDRLQFSMVEHLQQAGFATAAFTEGGFTSKFFGHDRGFDLYRDQEGAIRLMRKGEEQPKARASHGIQQTFDRALDWLRAHADEKFFLLIHSYETHMPYRNQDYAKGLPKGRIQDVFSLKQQADIANSERQATPQEIAYVRALYDSGVRSADRQVARLLAALEELGISDRTVIGLTSDHGEELGDRDSRSLGRHGHNLYQPILKIPLIVMDPRVRAARPRVGAQVRLIDVLPTLLELAGLEGLEAFEIAAGQSLLPLMRGESDEDRPAYAEIRSKEGPLSHVAISDGRFKLVTRPQDRQAAELYELDRDPNESVNLAEAKGRERKRLQALLRRQLASLWAENAVDENPKAPMPEALREQLDSLGYVE